MTASMARGSLMLAVALVLCGCAPAASMESPLLADAVAAATFDERARQQCESTYSGPPLIAAVDSTAGRVRELGEVVSTQRGWDNALPTAPHQFIAICIYDFSDADGIKGDPEYGALWNGTDDVTGGNGLITIW